MANGDNASDPHCDTEGGQKGVNHADGAAKVVAVEKIADRSRQGDSGNQRHNAADNNFVVENRGAKPRKKHGSHCHKGAAENIHDEF